MPKLIVSLAFVLLLTACSVFIPADKPDNGLVLLLPIKEESSLPKVVKQSVTFEKFSQQRQFIAVARFNAEQTKFVALSPSGQAFLYLTHDNQGLIEENLLDVALPAKEILATIQFTLWPKWAVEQGYPMSLGWHVEISDNIRQLFYKNTLLIKVEHKGDDINIENYWSDYKIYIHTFDKEV